MAAYFVKPEGMPENFPTHRHEPAFWEALGRAVATFGFLEEVLGKAIFVLTGTRPHPEDEFQAAYEKWLPVLEKSLHDPLGGLIPTYCKAVRDHPDADDEGLDDLLKELRKAAELRNVFCHGSWKEPDEAGASLPFFVNKQMKIFADPVDVEYLHWTRIGTVELACEVMNSVTRMGFQFPGSSGPGTPVWPARTGTGEERGGSGGGDERGGRG